MGRRRFGANRLRKHRLKKVKGSHGAPIFPQTPLSSPGLLCGAVSQSERLLDGLKCLLAEVEQESDVITESDQNGDALFSALQDLVSNRPKSCKN